MNEQDKTSTEVKTEAPSRATTEVTSKQDSAAEEHVARELTSRTESKGEEKKPEIIKRKSIRSALRENLKTSSEDIKKKPEAPTQRMQPDTVQAAAPTPVPTQVSAVLPPADMNAEEKAAFLNPTAQNVGTLQKYYSRRSYELKSDYSRQTDALSQKEKEVSGILPIAQREREYYAKRNLTIPAVVENAIAWDKAFATNKAQAAKEFLSHWGINPLDLVDVEGTTQPQNGNSNYLTREEAEALADERAERKFQSLMSTQQQSALVEQNNSVVQEFIKTKPLFQDIGTGAQLEQDMAPIVAGLRSQFPNKPTREILDTAYDYVTKGNPTYAALTQRLSASAVTEQANADAQKAKAASRSISGSPGSGSPQVQTKNRRENLRARYFGG